MHDLLDSDDTRVMLDALRALGCDVDRDGDVLRVAGLGGRLQVHEAQLFLGNAGTAMRPLAAALAVLAAHAGRPLRARAACRACTSGRSATWSMRCASSAARSTTWASPATRRCAVSGRPAAALAPDAPIRVRGDVSSQFLTALLLALPLVAADGADRRSRSTAS